MRARDIAAPACLALAGAFLLAVLGLQTMAFTDYEVEAEPALRRCAGHDLGLPAHLPPTAARSSCAPRSRCCPGVGRRRPRRCSARWPRPACWPPSRPLVLHLWPARAGRGLAGARSVAANPLTLRALEVGHPEELLGAALCAGAGLAALATAARLAGLLLGLALGQQAVGGAGRRPPRSCSPLAPGTPPRALARRRAGRGPAGRADAPLGGGVRRHRRRGHRPDRGRDLPALAALVVPGEHGHLVRGLLRSRSATAPRPGGSPDRHPLVVLVPLALAPPGRGAARVAGPGPTRCAARRSSCGLRCLLDTVEHGATTRCRSCWRSSPGRPGRSPRAGAGGGATVAGRVTLRGCPAPSRRTCRPRPTWPGASRGCWGSGWPPAPLRGPQRDDAGSVLRQRGQDLVAVVGDDDEVLDAHADGARHVDAGLDRDDLPGRQRGLALLATAAGPRGPRGPTPCPSPWPKCSPWPAASMIVAGDGVDLAAGRARAHRRQRRLLGRAGRARRPRRSRGSSSPVA